MHVARPGQDQFGEESIGITVLMVGLSLGQCHRVFWHRIARSHPEDLSLLGAVVRQHVVSVLAVCLVELGLRLPHGDELDTGARDGGWPLRELGSGVLAASWSTTRGRGSIAIPADCGARTPGR